MIGINSSYGISSNMNQKSACSYPSGTCTCLSQGITVDRQAGVIKTSFTIVGTSDIDHKLTIREGDYRGIGRLDKGDILNIQAPIPPNMTEKNHVSGVEFDPTTGKITFKFAEGEPEPVITCSVKHAPAESQVFKTDDLKESRTCNQCGKFNKWYRNTCWLCKTKLPFNSRRGEQAVVPL
jgi:hypothetical protein